MHLIFCVQMRQEYNGMNPEVTCEPLMGNMRLTAQLHLANSTILLAVLEEPSAWLACTSL